MTKIHDVINLYIILPLHCEKIATESHDKSIMLQDFDRAATLRAGLNELYYFTLEVSEILFISSIHYLTKLNGQTQSALAGDR